MRVYKMEEITEKIRPIAENYNIDKVYLFGSYARGEAAEESDIDLIVSGSRLRGLKFFGFYEDLKETFQKNVDLVTEEQIGRNRGNPLYKRFIEELENDRKVIYSV
ncbi:MAG: nucleotidyltransferase domain-containing protein [Ruminococcus sp.]|nr:nucleotidyltransferase domain-containing protein [Ruminococcus sp.]